MTDHADLAAALLEAAGHPWALATDRAPMIAAIVQDLALGRDVTPARLRAAIGSRPSAAPVRMQARDGKDVAVVSVRGILLYDLEFQPFATSSRKLALTMQSLAADNTVGAIVLDIDSPGGVVTGVPEASDAVFAARQRKPVVAVVNPLAASAAFWVAASASSVAVVPSGDVGSIGVFMLHLDMSGALERMGIKPTFIFEGPRKVDGNSFEPLSERARADFQADVATIYRDFVNDVARGRGVPAETVRKKFGEGRTLMAAAAKRAGMVDQIATFESALSTGASRERGRGGAAAIASRRPALSQKQREAEARRLRLRLLELK